MKNALSLDKMNDDLGILDLIKMTLTFIDIDRRMFFL